MRPVARQTCRRSFRHSRREPADADPDSETLTDATGVVRPAFRRAARRVRRRSEVSARPRPSGSRSISTLETGDAIDARTCGAHARRDGVGRSVRRRERRVLPLCRRRPTGPEPQPEKLLRGQCRACSISTSTPARCASNERWFARAVDLVHFIDAKADRRQRRLALSPNPPIRRRQFSDANAVTASAMLHAAAVFDDEALGKRALDALERVLLVVLQAGRWRRAQRDGRPRSAHRPRRDGGRQSRCLGIHRQHRLSHDGGGADALTRSGRCGTTTGGGFFDRATDDDDPAIRCPAVR